MPEICQIVGIFFGKRLININTHINLCLLMFFNLSLRTYLPCIMGDWCHLWIRTAAFDIFSFIRSLSFSLLSVYPFKTINIATLTGQSSIFCLSCSQSTGIMLMFNVAIRKLTCKTNVKRHYIQFMWINLSEYKAE